MRRRDLDRFAGLLASASLAGACGDDAVGHTTAGASAEGTATDAETTAGPGGDDATDSVGTSTSVGTADDGSTTDGTGTSSTTGNTTGTSTTGGTTGTSTTGVTTGTSTTGGTTAGGTTTGPGTSTATTASTTASTTTTASTSSSSTTTASTSASSTTTASTSSSSTTSTSSSTTTGASTSSSSTTGPGTTTTGSGTTGGGGLPPDAVDDFYRATQDTLLNVTTLTGVLKNDSDPDNDPISVSSYDAASLQGGTVLLFTDGRFRYTPPAGYWREDSFTYTITDGVGFDSATVTMLVRPTLAPVAQIESEVTGGFALNEPGAFAQTGRSVAGIGDMNGDGFDDVVLGAPYADSYAGRAYVVFGKPGLGSIDLAAVAAGTGGFVINGEAASFAGWSVSGGGDINGDNVEDVIVGVPYDTAAGGYAGRVFVVFGKSSGTAVDLAAVAGGTGGFVINSEGAYTYTGISVAHAGDVNGDGDDDILIGAQFAPEYDGVYEGRSYVVFGKSTGTAVDLSTVAAAGGGGFKLDGVNNYDGVGLSVAPAGNMDGDSYADIIIGAPGDNTVGSNSGRAYVVFGRDATAAVALADIAAGTEIGFAIQGAVAEESLGWSVGGGQDVSGDGRVDVVVGAPSWPGTSPFRGRAFVVFGKTDGTLVDVGSLGAGGFEIQGALNGNAGWSVALGEDINDDGTPDVLVGEHRAAGRGRVHVVLGKGSVTTVDLADVITGIDGFSFAGASAGDFLGFSVSGAGDVDNDGFPDFVVGGVDVREPPVPDPGRAYVICGDDFD